MAARKDGILFFKTTTTMAANPNQITSQPIHGEGIVAYDITVPAKRMWQIESVVSDIASHLPGQKCDTPWYDNTIRLLDILCEVCNFDYEKILETCGDSKLKKYLIEHHKYGNM